MQLNVIVISAEKVIALEMVETTMVTAVTAMKTFTHITQNQKLRTSHKEKKS